MIIIINNRIEKNLLKLIKSNDNLLKAFSIYKNFDNVCISVFYFIFLIR